MRRPLDYGDERRAQRRKLEENFAYFSLLSSGERWGHQAFLFSIVTCMFLFVFKWTHPILASLTCFAFMHIEHVLLSGTLRLRLVENGVGSEWDEQECAYQLVFREKQSSVCTSK